MQWMGHCACGIHWMEWGGWDLDVKSSAKKNDIAEAFGWANSAQLCWLWCWDITSQGIEEGGRLDNEALSDKSFGVSGRSIPSLDFRIDSLSFCIGVFEGCPPYYSCLLTLNLAHVQFRFRIFWISPHYFVSFSLTSPWFAQYLTSCHSDSCDLIAFLNCFLLFFWRYRSDALPVIFLIYPKNI